MRRPSMYLFLSLCFLQFTACKEQLYGKLDQNQANELVAVLMENGIESTRRQVEGDFQVLVEGKDLARAVQILKANGLPKRSYASLGEVFKDDKIIKTPFQERVLFVHAISEELSRSIADIDGVSASRVHIMLPENSRITGKAASSPSASVFVHVDSGARDKKFVSIIKEMVSHAVDGLQYENVAVAVFRRDQATQQPGKLPEREEPTLEQARQGLETPITSPTSCGADGKSYLTPCEPPAGPKKRHCPAGTSRHGWPAPVQYGVCKSEGCDRRRHLFHLLPRFLRDLCAHDRAKIEITDERRIRDCERRIFARDRRDIVIQPARRSDPRRSCKAFRRCQWRGDLRFTESQCPTAPPGCVARFAGGRIRKELCVSPPSPGSGHRTQHKARRIDAKCGFYPQTVYRRKCRRFSPGVFARRPEVSPRDLKKAL